jgi:hypothetical protein
MPNATHWTPETALKEALLAERAELTSNRSTPMRKRRKQIIACDRLLDKLARLVSEGEVR